MAQRGAGAPRLPGGPALQGRRGLRRVQGLGEERGVVLVDLGAGEPQPGRCGRAYATTRGLRYYRCIAQPA